MAYKPISGTFIQYSADGDTLASGYYLKAYRPGTNTPLSMGTDNVPTSTLAKCLLNTFGRPISNPADNTSEFIPHFNQDYRLVLYTNETDADNDVIANGFDIDNIDSIATLESEIKSSFFVDTYANLRLFDVSSANSGDGVILTDPGIAGTGVLKNVVSHGLIDDGGVIIVINANWYWERVVSGGIEISWYESGSDASIYFQSAIDYAETEGLMVVAEADKSYIGTTQVTVKHNVALDLRGAKYRLNHTGSNNDSCFQMGNNTKLLNCSELGYASTSASAFSTLGMIKIGEFYVEINGNPNSGENSFDSTYWEVSNIEISNVKGVASYMPLNTDKTFGAVVYILGGDNVQTDTISLDGLAGDGLGVPILSTIRTETGYDPNARRQGFNLLVNNTTGENLRAHPENAVVYINGDRNTKVVNVHGTSCGQIFACNSSGNAANQSPSLRGKSAVNIHAENIIGFDCKKTTGDTFSKLTAGVNIKCEEPDLLTGNRSQIYVSGIHLESTQTSTDKLGKGILVNDSLSTAINTRRIKVEGFEAYYFGEGLLIDADTRNVELSLGYLHHNGANGATIRGIQPRISNVKFSNNNQDGNTSANGFNGHGVALQCNQGVLDQCVFGDDTLAAGAETQLHGVTVTANDTTCELRSCRYANYDTGNDDIHLRSGITGAEIYQDETTKGLQRNISGDFTVAPNVAKVRASITGTGSTLSTYRCSIARVSDPGRYRVTFDKPFADTNYQLTASSVGGTGADTFIDWSSKSTTTVDIYTKNASGTLKNSDLDVVIFGNYDSQV